MNTVSLYSEFVISRITLTEVKQCQAAFNDITTTYII